MALPKSNLLQLNKAELKIAAGKLFELLGQGKSDGETRAELGLTQGQYEQLKKAMYRHQTDNLITRTTEETYINYIVAQNANMQDLTEMVREFKKTKQYNAMVGAIRTRADILDHVIKKGQEFGIIEKRPEEKRIIAGIMVANLTNPDLRKLITRELGQLDKMQAAYGDGQAILEMEPGPIYTPAKPKLLPAAVIEDESKTEPKRVKAKIEPVEPKHETEPDTPPPHLRFAQTSTMQSGQYPNLPAPDLSQSAKPRKNKPTSDPRLPRPRTQRAKNTKRFAGRKVVRKKRTQ